MINKKRTHFRLLTPFLFKDDMDTRLTTTTPVVNKPQQHAVCTVYSIQQRYTTAYEVENV